MFKQDVSVPSAAIRKAYLVMVSGTHKLDRASQTMNQKNKKCAQHAVRARRAAQREIENWWPTIAEEFELDHELDKSQG